nr:integrase, catalytic region, zinc finger, CCHC-type, peptidase aspartic, catalytic [Tanacetum cinerariifolium]
MNGVSRDNYYLEFDCEKIDFVIREGGGDGCDGTVREKLAEGTEGAPYLGPKRPWVFSDLSPKEKDRYTADIRETNILLQGLPKDIYTLINHYTDAKDIWDNVKMLLKGSELTKEDQESQMYTSLKQRNIINADISLSQSLYISLKFYVEDIDWKH